MTTSATTSATPLAPPSLAVENERLRLRLAEATAENERLTEALAAAEEQGAGLVKLYVSNRRLNEAADRGDALTAIQEIVISVVGCEEFAIVERDARDRVTLAASYGLDDPAAAAAPLRSAVVRSVVDTGRAFFAATPAVAGANPLEMTACVPLVAGDRVIGAIVLYGLLPHRGGELDQTDRSLLDLISREAGRTLAARKRAGAGAA